MKPPACACCRPLSSRTSPVALRWAIALVLGYSAIEWIAGRFSHSLSLVADSGHMLADGIALGLALWATWRVRQRGAGDRLSRHTAIANGLSLLLMAGLVAWEALRHLQEPPHEMLSLPTLLVAVLGLIVNGTSVLLLRDDSQQDLTLRGAFLHAVADALGSVGAIVAAVVAYCWGWHWVDTAIGLSIAGFVGLSAIPLLRRSLRPSPDPTAIARSPWLEVGQSDLAQVLRSRSGSSRESHALDRR